MRFTMGNTVLKRLLPGTIITFFRDVETMVMAGPAGRGDPLTTLRIRIDGKKSADAPDDPERFVRRLANDHDLEAIKGMAGPQAITYRLC